MQNNKQVRIWGKSEGITLEQHIKDIYKAFYKLRSKVKDREVRKCIKLAIKLHDLGKALPYFQIIMMRNKEYEPFSVYKNTYIYHSIASLLFINKEKLREILDRKEDLANFVLSAVAYHHWNGSLERDMQATEKYQALLKDINLLEKSLENLKEELGQLFCDEEKSLLEIDYHMLQGLARDLNVSEYAVPPYRMDWIPLRKDISQDMARKWVLISGFLMRCDHYASYCETAEDWNSKSEQERSIELKKVEIDNIKYEDILNQVKRKVQDKAKRAVNLWQEEKIRGRIDKSIILVAPTGSGKTEFAFLWSNGEKLIYTLPIRAIVEQTYERAKDIFGEERVGLLHGDADIYLLGEEQGSAQEYSDAPEQEKLIAQEKLRVYELSKELSPAVIVSTGDQFFPYALRPPGYERIYATLSYSRLVIDEVQAYDPVA
ncbi:MAG: CRISPR-associated endonuclease Cas3'', partial [Caldimicrobium sp.]|nr:CRISPR-associated endonuclease Cas3'' [Caldimicrobium sp.]